MTDGDEWVELDIGTSVTLNCAADGTPAPSISWVREDEKPIRINSSFTGKFSNQSNCWYSKLMNINQKLYLIFFNDMIFNIFFGHPTK